LRPFFVPRVLKNPGDKKKPGNDLLSHPFKGSTIGAGELNFRVRNGNGWNLSAIITRQNYETRADRALIAFGDQKIAAKSYVF
jgi:hypothetical protein